MCVCSFFLCPAIPHPQLTRRGSREPVFQTSPSHADRFLHPSRSLFPSALAASPGAEQRAGWPGPCGEARSRSAALGAAAGAAPCRGRGVGRQHEQERVDVEEGVSPKSYPLLASQAALTRNQGVCKRREGIEGKKPRRKAGGSGEKEENLANE